MTKSPTTALTQSHAALAASVQPESPAERPPITLLGVVFDAVTMAETLDRIDTLVTTGGPGYVVTPNVDFLAQARHDPVLRRILREADLVLCDGMPLVWASRWLGNPLPGRVTGADLAPRLLALAAAKQWRIFLLGASPEANARAAAWLRVGPYGLSVVGNYAPPNQPLHAMDHGAIVQRIRATRPHLLFVSFGCPKQEKWIAMHYRTLGVPVCLGVGAVVDFLAGSVRRAPRWMQESGLEWAYRLWQEPRRLFRRYLADAVFFGHAVLAQCWLMSWRPGGPDGAMTCRVDDDEWRHVEVYGRLDRIALEQSARVTRQIAGNGRSCVLNLTHVTFIDSTGLAWLVRLQRQFQAEGRQLVLRAPGPAVERTLEAMQLGDFFKIVRTGWSPLAANARVA